MTFLRELSQHLKELEDVSQTGVFRELEKVSKKKWILHIENISDCLLRYSKTLLPCPDGFFREPSRAVQEILIENKVISVNSSDCCSNIPWKFFKRNKTEVPWDKRVIHLKDYSQMLKVDLHDVFSDWGGRGGADILNLSKVPYCIEVKMPCDEQSMNQRDFELRLRNARIDYITCYIKERRPLTDYRQNRTNLRRNSGINIDEFWNSKTGKKLDTFIKKTLEYNPVNNRWIINSKSEGLDELCHYHIRAGALIKVIDLCYSPWGVNLAKLSLSLGELYEITELVFYGDGRGANYKWWKVPYLLSSQVNDSKGKRELLSLIYRFELLMRTEHMSVPSSSYYFKNKKGYRSKPLELKLKEAI